VAADGQVVERDEDGDPVWRAVGDGQGLGEQPRGRLVIPLGEPDLAEEVVHKGYVQQLLDAVGPGELVSVQLPEQGLALVEQVAGASVLVLRVTPTGTPDTSSLTAPSSPVSRSW
jgi:hypothetical protein